MQGPFKPAYYTVEVLTPVFIGAAKENDYALGEDYFYNDSTGEYVFVHQRAFQRLLTVQEVTVYAAALAKNDVDTAERLLKKKAAEHPEVIWHRSYCPYGENHFERGVAKQAGFPTIRKHITDAAGNIVIPGSSIKGALRTIIGTYLMRQTKLSDFNEYQLFGSIDKNFMRLLQVADVHLNRLGAIVPAKLYSGDVVRDYGSDFEGEGMWKDAFRGRHTPDFNTAKGVMLHEAAPVGAKSTLRLNWGNQLLDFINRHSPGSAPSNSNYLGDVSDHRWLEIAKIHSRSFLQKEVAFFEKFYSDTFYDAVDLLQNLLSNNSEEGSVVIRLGAGSGFHSITGDWQAVSRDHIFATGQARDKTKQLINAINYKTRKIAFMDDGESDDAILYFPGFVKISVL